MYIARVRSWTFEKGERPHEFIWEETIVSYKGAGSAAMSTSIFRGELGLNRRGTIALAVITTICLGLFLVPAMAKAAAPEVSLQQAVGQADPTGNDQIDFSLTSNESLVSGSVATSDFSATNGTVDSITEVGPAEYTVNVTADSDGAVTIAPSETFEVTDLDEALTQNTAAGSDRSVTYDSTAPTVVLEQHSEQDDPTANDAIVFSFTGDEGIDENTVEESDFDVTNASNVEISGGGNNYVIDVTAAADGPVTIAPSGTFSVTDFSGNDQTSAEGADRSVTYDGTAPSVSLAAAPGQDDPTNVSAIEFELTSDEDLSGGSVNDSDFSATNGTVTGVSGTGDTFTVSVTATDQGAVELSPSGAFSVEDLVGNEQTSASGTPSVLYDTAPVITVDQASGQDDPTNDPSIEFEITSNEDLDGSTLQDYTDFDIQNANSVLITENDPQSFTLTVGALDDGPVTVGVFGTFSVSDTNGNFPATTATIEDGSVTFDDTAPTTSIVGNPSDPTFDPTPTFDLSSDDAGSTFECRLWNNNDPAPGFDDCADPYTSAFLAEGNYSFEARSASTLPGTPATPSLTSSPASRAPFRPARKKPSTSPTVIPRSISGSSPKTTSPAPSATSS